MKSLLRKYYFANIHASLENVSDFPPLISSQRRMRGSKLAFAWLKNFSCTPVFLVSKQLNIDFFCFWFMNYSEVLCK